jgi:ribosomal protein S18 acetylase RimI-like enzyme
MTEIVVRPYQCEDRAALHRIAADTAFFGEPVEREMDDRRLLLDFLYVYYTDYEPEHVWVACAGDEVVGFLTGCTDTARKDRIFNRRILPRVVGRVLTGHYHSGRRTWRYLRGFLGAGLRGENPPVDLERYPAHLHINVDAAWRGHGLGRRLMQAYLEQLQSLGIPGVHLGTTSYNRAACSLYEKMGFRLLAARPTRMWAHLLQEPVELRVYGLDLTTE